MANNKSNERSKNSSKIQKVTLIVDGIKIVYIKGNSPRREAREWERIAEEAERRKNLMTLDDLQGLFVHPLSKITIVDTGLGRGRESIATINEWMMASLLWNELQSPKQRDRAYLNARAITQDLFRQYWKGDADKARKDLDCLLEQKKQENALRIIAILAIELRNKLGDD